MRVVGERVGMVVWKDREREGRVRRRRVRSIASGRSDFGSED